MHATTTLLTPCASPAKVRGVNIGGWLVSEPWITPSLYDNTGDNRVIDEWTFGEYVSDVGSRLESHWSSFITEDDFRQIAAAGLNHVRIPIGYWAIDNTHGYFYKGSQMSHLQDAVGWARTYGLKVMIDLHGAPGEWDVAGVEWPERSGRGGVTITDLNLGFSFRLPGSQNGE